MCSLATVLCNYGIQLYHGIEKHCSSHYNTCSTRFLDIRIRISTCEHYHDSRKTCHDSDSRGGSGGFSLEGQTLNNSGIYTS